MDLGSVGVKVPNFEALSRQRKNEKPKRCICPEALAFSSPNIFAILTHVCCRYGSYNPAAQLGMQPPSHQLEDPPLPALLTCQKPIIAQQSEKESLAEEGLLEAEDDSEVEEKGPNSNYILFGLDFKPLLPLFLAMSTLAGAICVLVVQIPMVGEFTPLGAEWLYGLYGAFSLIFVVTLVLMAYCAFIDPGQLQTPSVDGDIEHGLPQRAHKCWLYNRPIRRYDHYCKCLSQDACSILLGILK